MQWLHIITVPYSGAGNMLRIAHRPAQHFYTSFLMESELYFVSFWRVSSIKSRKTKNKCAFKQEGMILHGGIPFLYIFTNSFQFPLKSLPSLKREKKAVDLHVLEAYAILVSVSDRMGASGNAPAGK